MLVHVLIHKANIFVKNELVAVFYEVTKHPPSIFHSHDIFSFDKSYQTLSKVTAWLVMKIVWSKVLINCKV